MRSADAPTPAAPAGDFVLIEDDRLLGDLLVRTIQAQFAPRSLRTFADGAAGLAHCLAHPPDLLITDLQLPGVGGLDIIRRLRARKVATRFLVLTGHAAASLPGELIALGVAGFIDKRSPLTHAELAIARVLEGGLYFTAAVSPPPSAHLGGAEGIAASSLTEQEREIVRLVAEGLFSKEIGERVGLPTRAVEKKRAQVMEKIGVRDLPGLIRWCVRQGLA